MYRAECIRSCRSYENRSFVCSFVSVYQSRGSYALTSAVSSFGTKKRRRDFHKEGTLVHQFGSVPKARPAEIVGSKRTNQTRIKRIKAFDDPYNIFQYVISVKKVYSMTYSKGNR